MSARPGKFYRPQTEAQARTKPCDHPGCLGEGAFRAPKSRDHLGEYFWFCLDHVRAYNSQWDFYKGMTPDEIESAMRLDATWQRPTWPLGKNMGNRPGGAERFRDAFGVFDDWQEEQARRPVRPVRPMGPEQEALKVMDLTLPLTLELLKSRYKELVKRHHPDLNGGSKVAEEIFKTINQAYKILKDSLDA